MNSTLTWLSERELDGISRRSAPNQALLGQRYHPTCPSEWYRGYATMIARLCTSVPSTASTTAAQHLIERLDQAVSTVSDQNLLGGAKFATMNASAYADAAPTVRQLETMLEVELVCIAQCFVSNRSKGL